MDQIVLRKVGALLGLGVRARTVVVGVDLVRTAAQRGRLALAVVASDAAANSRAKLLPLLRAKGVECIEGPSAADLAVAVGKPGLTAAVGVVDAALAKGIRAAVHAALKAV